jgi:hypothetical protein
VGRPFDLAFPDAKTPFFHEVLEPGTAVIMTIDANLLSKHGVPVVEGGECGPSGSIVFRTIETRIDRAYALAQIEKRLSKRKREDVETK